MTVVALAGALTLGLLTVQDPSAPDPAIASDQPAAEQTEPQEQPADLGTIVVEGTLQERARAFVRDIGAPPPYRRLARWHRKVCVGVANMERDHAQFMVDRISEMAREVGLEAGEPGCGPTIVVVATDNSAELARLLVEDYDRMMRPVRGISDRGRRGLAEFRDTDAPVRWWHVSLPMDVDTGSLALGAIKVRQMSRIRSSTREQMAFTLILLDVNRVGTVPFGPLSDYLGLVALSQVDPATDYSGYQTIMNLFGPDGRSATLSDWDRDYLASLYYVPGDSARVSQEVRQIADQMVRRQTRDRPADQPD